MKKSPSIHALLAQFPVSVSIQQNLACIQSILQEAHPGDLVVLPEGALSGYSDDLSFLENIDDRELLNALSKLRNEASQRAIHLWLGVCYRQDGWWYNAAWGFTPDSKYSIYHKINLANHERGIFTPGDKLPVYRLRFPEGEMTIGVQLCRELRYPEQWGWLARQGAQVILHLNNAVGSDREQPVWRSHLVSRAAETQRFVLSANNAAALQKCPTLAIAPDGKVLAEVVSAETSLLRVELNLAKASDNYLAQCRTDVVAITPGKEVHP